MALTTPPIGAGGTTSIGAQGHAGPSPVTIAALAGQGVLDGVIHVERRPDERFSADGRGCRRRAPASRLGLEPPTLRVILARRRGDRANNKPRTTGFACSSAPVGSRQFPGAFGERMPGSTACKVMGRPRCADAISGRCLRMHYTGRVSAWVLVCVFGAWSRCSIPCAERGHA